MSRIRSLALPTVIAVGVSVGVVSLGSGSAAASHSPGGGVAQSADMVVAIPAQTVGVSTPTQLPKQLCLNISNREPQCVPTSGAVEATVAGLNAVVAATYTLASSTHPSNVVSKVGLVCPDDERDTDTQPHFGAIWQLSDATYQSGSHFEIKANLNGTDLQPLTYDMVGSNEARTIGLTGISLC